MPRKKPNEIPFYDYTNAEKRVLRYVGRAASVKDPGVARHVGGTDFTKTDNLCKMHWGGMLTGAALADAQAYCPPPPENYEVPDRFVKPLTETGQDYP